MSDLFLKIRQNCHTKIHMSIGMSNLMRFQDKMVHYYCKTGIQITVIMTRKTMNILATMICSVCDGLLLRRFQMSIVKMVVAELNTEVKEDIRADIMAANISPASPGI